MTVEESDADESIAAVAVGRPALLTDEVIDRILAAVKGHQRLEVAAEMGGVGRATLYGWLRAGARAKDHLANGGDPAALTVLERRCADLTASIENAMGLAEATAVHHIVRAGLRPSVETRRTTRCLGLVDGQPVYVDEVTTTERAPDPRALQWWLERRVPGYGQRTELTGANGGPVAIEFAARIEAVHAKIAAHQAAIAAQSKAQGE